VLGVQGVQLYTLVYIGFPGYQEDPEEVLETQELKKVQLYTFVYTGIPWYPLGI
jgi:hypothetical protein